MAPRVYLNLKRHWHVHLEDHLETIHTSFLAAIPEEITVSIQLKLFPLYCLPNLYRPKSESHIPEDGEAQIELDVFEESAVDTPSLVEIEDQNVTRRSSRSSFFDIV